MTRKAPMTVADRLRRLPDGRFQILTGRVELGQGILGALRLIAARELGLPPEALSILSGDTALCPDEGSTVGSRSVAGAGMALRRTAATLRRAVLRTAAAELGTDPARLALSGGAIVQAGQPSGLTLWEVAGRLDLAGLEVAANPGPPGELPPSPPATPPPSSTPPPGARAQITGAPYLHDLVLPGMVHGRMLHPPSLGARIARDETAGLETRPGVLAVLRLGHLVGLVAATPAEAEETRRWAAARLHHATGEHPPEDGLAWVGAAYGKARLTRSRGRSGPERGAVHALQACRPWIAHAPLAPSVALALWEETRLTVWCSSQGVFALRRALARVLRLPERAVHLRHLPGPGCYGQTGADDAALDAALLARALPGRPVRLAWSLADEFRLAPLGAAMSLRARLGLDENGRMVSYESTINSTPQTTRPGHGGAVNLRAAAFLPRPRPISAGEDLPPDSGGGADRDAVPAYPLPHLRISRQIVEDLPWRSSALRSLGAFLNVYASEMLVDQAARARGADPFDWRLAHLDCPRARALLERLRAEGADLCARCDGQHSGWGLGFARYRGTGALLGVLARVTPGDAQGGSDPGVTDLLACADAGEIIDPPGARAQISGAMVQATSWTLKESVAFDGPRIATAGWADYPILSFSETPRVTVHLIDRPDQPPEGLGEAAMGPTAAAIGTALSGLIGRPLGQLPLTRARLEAARAAPAQPRPRAPRCSSNAEKS